MEDPGVPRESEMIAASSWRSNWTLKPVDVEKLSLFLLLATN